jgi:hypothetical protein
MNYEPLAIDQDVDTVFNQDDSIVTERMWLEEGIYPATPKTDDDGNLLIGTHSFTDGKHLGKALYLMPVVVKLTFDDGSKETVEGDICVSSKIALKDAQNAMKEGKSIYIDVTHNDEKGACYCTLASNVQARIKRRAIEKHNAKVKAKSKAAKTEVKPVETELEA